MADPDWLSVFNPSAPEPLSVWRCWFEPFTEHAWYRARWGSASIGIERFSVVRTTPKGVWLRTYEGEPNRFVRFDTRKQWASPTEAEAIRQLLFRTRSRIAILAAQHDEAKKNMALFEKGMSLYRENLTSKPQ